MTEVARYKTIATIAVAFSLGTITTAACGGGPLAAANTKQLEADIADLQDEIDSIKCVLDTLASGVPANGEIVRPDVLRANNQCGI
jgi:hypothetical protein